MDFSRNVRILTWQGFLIGCSLWAPIAAIYFSQVAGSYVLGLSIFSIANMSGAFFEIPTGVFSDLIGRKYTTILGGLAYTLSGICYAIGLNFWWLVAGAILGGLGRSFYSGNNDALLYDSLSKSQKKGDLEKWMGNIGGAEQWALGITAVIGGVLAAKYSFGLIMWLSVVPLLLCFITSFWLIEVENKVLGEGNVFLHLKEAWSNFLNNEKLRLLTISDTIMFGLSEASYQFTPVFVASLWPLWAIGIARMLANVGAAVGFGLSGKLIKRFGAVKIILVERIYSKVVSIVAFVFPSGLSPVLLSSTSILYGPYAVSYNSLIQREFSDKQRATMGSMNSLSKSVFYGVAMWGMGWIADMSNPRWALILGQIFSLVTVWMTWQLVKMIRAEKQA